MLSRRTASALLGKIGSPADQLAAEPIEKQPVWPIAVITLCSVVTAAWVCVLVFTILQIGGKLF